MEHGLDGRVYTFVGNIFNLSHNTTVAVYTVLVAILVVLFGRLATRKLELVPSGVQNIGEALIGGILFIAKDVVGEELARKYLPLAGSVALTVCFANLIGIIPGFEAPTSTWSFTLTLALVVFVFYHSAGIKKYGFFKYFGHFAGPMKFIAPFMFIIEIISHFSRLISLSFRLFGNIKGDDIFLIVMILLAPYLAPLAAFSILFFMAFLQAFIFMMLTYVYLSGAVLMDEAVQ